MIFTDFYIFDKKASVFVYESITRFLPDISPTKKTYIPAVFFSPILGVKFGVTSTGGVHAQFGHGVT